MSELTERAIAWARGRGISRETLVRVGAKSGTEHISDRDGKCEVIYLPFTRQGKVVNWKARTLDGKAYVQCKGGESKFFNLEPVLTGQADTAYITEGEFDALALLEAGLPIDQVLSVPNGAPAQSAEKPEEQDRYRFVDAALNEGLNRFKKFVLATDQDPPGLALRHDLVRLLGPARCWFVDWPEGINDANEFLTERGGAELKSYVEGNAKEWPVIGLYSVHDIPEPAPLEIWRPGFPGWEGKLSFAPTTVSVVTGHPGHGKSTLMTQIWYQIARRHGISVAVASFETRAKPHHRRNIRQFMFERLERDLTQEECDAADKWNAEHFRWLIHPNRKPTFKWVLDTAEVAVIRHNCRALLLDPWNRLESDRPDGVREHEWIGTCLDEATEFARDMNVHVQIVSHPAKATDFRQRKQHPVLEDISGSKSWDTKPEQGLCIHRPVLFKDGQRQTDAILYVLKSRYDELGYPCNLAMNYDLGSGCFESVGYRAAHETAA